MVLLKSNDGLTIEVSEEAALLSQMVKIALEESEPDWCLPLDNINGEVLSKIVEYLTMQTEFASKKPPEMEKKLPELADDVAEEALEAWKKDVEIWEKKYMDIDMNMLYDLYQAANFMDIKGLLSMCAEKIAGFIMGKSVKQIRKFFNIKNDLTPEEEEKIQEPNKWAFCE